MVSQVIGEQPQLLTQLQQQFAALTHEDAGAAKRRTKAWERFQQLGLPSRKQGVFQYVPLRRLYEGAYEPIAPVTEAPDGISDVILPECLHSHIVLLNGQYRPELSDLSALDSRVVVSDLHEATHSFGTFMSNYWAQILKDETDAFAVLNAALHGAGVFLYVPSKQRVEAPIQIIHLVCGQKCLAQPRVQVVMGSDAALTLIESTVDTGSSGYIVNAVVDFTLEDNAQVHYVQSTPEIAADSWHFKAVRARLKRDANLHAVNVTQGARTVRNDYRVALNGTGGEAALNDLWMLKDKREVHANVLMEHAAPHCRSHQHFKGALADLSRSSFEGKIFVQRPAQKTEAYQLNNHLLLSDHANADSKPNLEIFADDVKASHGSTVGQLDAEQLFYLKARGLSDLESKNILVHGFAREIVNLIRVSSLQEQLLARVRAFLI